MMDFYLKMNILTDSLVSEGIDSYKTVECIEVHCVKKL